MKKFLFYIATLSTVLTACDSDYIDPYKIKEVKKISTQNANDDQAIDKFLNEHYLDAQGKIKAFLEADTSDDQNTKLADLAPQKLPSGVVVIVRPGAQPDNGKTIGETDVIKIMQTTYGYLSDDDKEIYLHSPYPFVNTVDGAGTPDQDPAYYYTKNSVLTSSDKERSYYEMEGFQEGLKHFKSFSLNDEDIYNLQGVIIVPSRAAYARDSHYPYQGISWRNRTFVFNFQIYNTRAREASEN